MIKGIGMDIVEIERMNDLLLRNERIKERVLTESEKKVLETLPFKRKVEFIAGRFAAKEAFSKAYGTGIGKDLSFQDIEVTTDERGKPYIVKPFREGVHLSITHSKHYALAQVIIESVEK
ncbi:holo-ACP synthase [Bacillus andreraoultii]|uniref:holo-ACP synthase n=1 Tax=Bacillus andreraoultii TaxID=1499685 RepID=UPI00053B9BD7|nr:holo-ACP synthase [Bacillus andreraoultii]